MKIYFSVKLELQFGFSDVSKNVLSRYFGRGNYKEREREIERYLHVIVCTCLSFLIHALVYVHACVCKNGEREGKEKKSLLAPSNSC